MEWSEKPKLKPFLEAVKMITDEIGMRSDGNIASHKIQGRVRIECENEELENVDYEITGIEPDLLPGRGCWDTLVIKIKKTYDQ